MLPTNFITLKPLFTTLVAALLGLVISRDAVAQPGQVSVQGINISYESFGSKTNETILLIAGTNAQLTMWPVEFCNRLVKHGYRVIRFDNRDIGLSTRFENAGMPDWGAISKALQEKTPPPLPYTLDSMAKDAVGLLDALSIKKAHIVGMSMGGMIAQRIAYNHPEHTLSLASIASGGGAATFPMLAKPEVLSKIPQPGDPKDTADFIKREVLTRTILAGPVYVPDQTKLLTEVKMEVNRSYYPEGFMRQAAVSTVGFYTGREEQLKTIKVPAIVVHGTEDPLVVSDAGKNVAANIPGASFEIVKGMGHHISEPVIDTLVELIVKNAAKARSN